MQASSCTPPEPARAMALMPATHPWSPSGLGGPDTLIAPGVKRKERKTLCLLVPLCFRQTEAQRRQFMSDLTDKNSAKSLDYPFRFKGRFNLGHFALQFDNARFKCTIHLPVNIFDFDNKIILFSEHLILLAEHLVLFA